jgi:hypothetical protein
VSVGTAGDDPEQDTADLGRDRALQPLLAPVHRRPPGPVTAGRGLDDAAIDRDLAQPEAAHPVAGLKCESVDLLGYPQLNPLFDAAPDAPTGPSGAGDPLVTGAVEQREHDVLEDRPVGDPTRGVSKSR